MVAFARVMQSRLPVMLASLIVISSGPSTAQGDPDPSTVLVTVAQANAICLIETETLPAEQAMAIAKAFLTQQGITATRSNAVQRNEDFNTLMLTYIQQRGGCEQLVQELKQ